MAGTMQFDLVSPERSLVSVEATEVLIPGAEGDMTVMPGHAPLITTLRPGVLTVVTAQGSTDYVVTGGFAEINAESASVLAELAHSKEHVTQEMVTEMVAEAHRAHREAEPDVVEASAKLLNDMVSMGRNLGYTANVPE